MDPSARRFGWFRTIPGLTVLAILLTTAGFAGAAGVSILTQTVPAGTTPSAGVAAPCSAVSMDTTASNASSTVAEAVYNCTTSPALSVTTAGSYSPSYTLPTAFVDAALVPATTKGVPTSITTTFSCSGYSGEIPLTSGIAATLSVGSYDYCFDSGNPGSAISSFTVSWG